MKYLHAFALLACASVAYALDARVIAPPGERVTIAPLPASRLSLGSGRHPALAGWSLRWERLGEHRPLPVTIHLTDLPARPGAPALRRRWLFAATPAQWVHAVRGGTLEIELPAHHTIELLWADLASYRDFSGPYRLVADPADPHPLGARRPLVLVHGLMWSSPDQPFSHLMQDALTRTVSRHPAMRALRRDYKLYAFEYPSFAGTRAAARRLVDEVRALYPDTSPPARSIVLLAHSLGGLVSRRALNLEGFGDSVRRLYTLATPHRGTLIASIATARPGLRDLVGDFNYGLLKNFMGMLVPACAALDELAWDDHDLAVTRPDLIDLGVRANPELAAFNACDRYLDRVTAITGDCPNLRKDVLGLPLDYIRSAQGILGSQFANSDPLVPCLSGAFAGAPVARLHLKRINHIDWAVDRGVVSALLERIADEAP
jgi:hypothetical protein